MNKNRKKYYVGQILRYTDKGICIEAKIVKDHYVTANVIHVIDLHILWTSEDGDISKQNTYVSKKAEWLYINAAIDKDIPTSLIRKKVRKKLGKFRKTKQKFGYYKDTKKEDFNSLEFDGQKFIKSREN
jgi:hypothetical protein